MTNTLMFRLVAVVSATACFAILPTAHAEEDGDAPPRKPRREAPAPLDANGDGSVSFDEYAASRLAKIRAKFDAMDKDGDGVLSAAELAPPPRDDAARPKRVKKEEPVEDGGAMPPDADPAF